MKGYSKKIGETRYCLDVGIRRRQSMNTWFSVYPVTSEDSDGTEKVCGVGIFGVKRGILLYRVVIK